MINNHFWWHWSLIEPNMNYKICVINIENEGIDHVLIAVP